MKKDKVVTLKYTHRIVEEADGIKIPEYRYRQIVMNFTKRYHNCLYQLAGLNSSCRDLLDYLCERMDENNMVHSNKAIREDFVDFISTITSGSVVYSDVTVKKAFATLSYKSLLLPRTRGSYQVNPEFFFRREEEERLRQIRLVLEFDEDGDKK